MQKELWVEEAVSNLCCASISEDVGYASDALSVSIVFINEIPLPLDAFIYLLESSLWLSNKTIDDLIHLGNMWNAFKLEFISASTEKFCTVPVRLDKAVFGLLDMV